MAAAAAAKLVFYMNGQPLSSSTSVFQAINQAHLAAAHAHEEEEDTHPEAGGPPRHRRLWDEIYTLHYALAGPDGGPMVPAPGGSSSGVAGTSAAPAAAAAAPLAPGSGRPPSGRRSSSAGGGRLSNSGSAPPAAAAAAAGGGGAGSLSAAPAGESVWRRSPLGELLSVRLAPDLAMPESCSEVLALLQLLEAISRLGPRAAACLELADLSGGSSSGGGGGLQLALQRLALAGVPREEWVSSKLGSKLGQQLKDVLSICGGGLPAWCRSLVVSARLLFPFEVRRRYFYSTAFGLARALQHMQQQQNAEGLGGGLERDSRELRIGRLQRRKVRVSRRRILDSAIKVMEMYAKDKAVLELEYFGEVGTGLGPTLEFFTLLSHELRRKALGMWRHEEPSTPDGAAAQPQGGSGGGGARAAMQQQQQHQAGEATGAGPTAALAQHRASSFNSHASATQLAEEAATHDTAAPGAGSGGAAADAFVYAPWGLFPCPLSEAARGGPVGQRQVELFRLLGRTVAKALQDNRLLDLPLSHLFFRWGVF